MKKVVIVSSIVAAIVATVALVFTYQGSSFSPADYLD